MLRIDTSALDYLIIGLYFVTVLGVGFLARRLIKSDLDFFLSGRSLPAWITGLAFISANLGALEIRLSRPGIFGSDADKDKAAGVNVNLWVGLALLIACAVFWGWALNRPLSQELSERDGG